MFSTKLLASQRSRILDAHHWLRRANSFFFICWLFAAVAPGNASPAEMPFIRVTEDKQGFVTTSGKRFIPWGVNYDHDDRGRLLEDYWQQEWPLVELHFAEIKQLKANVVRIHLQFGRFMESATKPNREAHTQLGRLLALAERTGLYLDLTGLGCYHKQDVPAWYDDLTEQERWDAQSVFWQSIAETCQASPAIFCYDLMNEPVVPGGKRNQRDWLGPAFAGKHFVQCISLDQHDRPRPDIAAAWLKQLTAAVRKIDDRHLITVGLVDWSLDRPGLTSGFVPRKVAEHVDFLCVHLYPESGKLKEAAETLAGFQVGKPVIVEETFPLKCSTEELATFIKEGGRTSCGWISFYWGKPVHELRKSTEIRDAILLQWLEKFEELAPTTTP
ncbi:MAG TPA: cellulase family glycosylhydrolase [Schlesneria sp.]